MSRTKTIYVNGRALGRRISGVERYSIEVVRCLGERIHTAHPPRWMPAALGHLWEQIYLGFKLPRGALLWSPANSGPLGVARQVVTIHDLSPLEHTEWFQPAFARWYRSLLPRLVARVKAVIAPSAYTKSRLVTAFPSFAKKVHIIPNGVDTSHFYPRPRPEQERVLRHHRLPARYILAVGTLQPRKNIPALLAAWDLVRTRLPGLSLVVAGGVGPQFKSAGIHTRPAGVYLPGYLPHADLPALYSGASLFISTSLEEGFGLTLLEAMACGAPVAASRAGALPALLEGAGILFDPRNPLEISACIEQLYIDVCLRADLAAAGLERARALSWEKTAASTWELLDAYA